MLAAFFILPANFFISGRGFIVFSSRHSSELLITTTAYSSPRLIFLAFSSAIKMQATVDATLMHAMTVIIYALKIFKTSFLYIFIHERGECGGKHSSGVTCFFERICFTSHFNKQAEAGHIHVIFSL